MSWVNGWISSLRPKDYIIFNLIQDATVNMRLTAEAYLQMIEAKGQSQQEEAIKNVRDLEHQGDDLTHSMLDHLNRTFITPFSREDLIALVVKIDDVVDLINDASQSILIYGVEILTQGMKDMIRINHDAVLQACEALSMIKKYHNSKAFKKYFISIHQLENDGDDTVKDAIKSLVHECKDPIQLFRYDKVYTTMEKAIDKVEDLAHVIETIVIKHG